MFIPLFAYLFRVNFCFDILYSSCSWIVSFGSEFEKKKWWLFEKSLVGMQFLYFNHWFAFKFMRSLRNECLKTLIKNYLKLEWHMQKLERNKSQIAFCSFLLCAFHSRAILFSVIPSLLLFFVQAVAHIATQMGLFFMICSSYSFLFCCLIRNCHLKYNANSNKI